MEEVVLPAWEDDVPSLPPFLPVLVPATLGFKQLATVEPWGPRETTPRFPGREGRGCAQASPLTMPWLLSLAASQPDAVHVVLDRHLVTGQNDASTVLAVQNLVFLCGSR